MALNGVKACSFIGFKKFLVLLRSVRQLFGFTDFDCDLVCELGTHAHNDKDRGNAQFRGR